MSELTGPLERGLTDLITLHGGATLTTHGPAWCQPHTCTIHNPSGHRLSDRPLHWRSDLRIMERICEHGVGHPDPDGIDFIERRYGVDRAYSLSLHGCCPEACCVED